MIEGKDWAAMDNNRVDWAKVPDAFVIVRAAYTYAGKCAVDATCNIVRSAAKGHGKTFGAYMILGWHGDSPEQQADNFIKVYGARQPGELPPSLDLEADSSSSLHMTAAQCLGWAERAYLRLKATYGTVMVYTSARVWRDVFGNLSSNMSEAPLWLKVPYPYKVHNPPHPEACPAPATCVPPTPWQSNVVAGVWIIQYQGDARPCPGFSNTADCNRFYARKAPDSMWLCRLLTDAQGRAYSIQEWQTANGLVADGILGPKGFAHITM